MAEQPAETVAGSAPPARLGERFEIYPDRPLAELRSPSGPAYAAVDRERSAVGLFAVVYDPDLPPRHEALTALHGMRGEGLLVPQHWGVVDWAPAGRRCFAVFFDRPAGGAVAASPSQEIAPLSEDDIRRNLLPPLLVSLREIFAAGLTHRAIRPSNLFYRDATRKALLLGDCVSAPPGALQPIACETIESGMAMPAGRGNGTPADDLYSLGATLLFLILGRNPVAAMPGEELLAAKMARGSYFALLGGERLNGGMIELLRGLLTDDAHERWSLQDIEMWLEGRRAPPKQPSVVRRAGRPFEFAGGEYYTARTLAHAFAGDPAAAARALKEADFAVWMQRSLADEERSKMLAAAFAEGRDGAAASQDERLVARVAIALDPLAPIRYRGFAADIDGFGTALVAPFRGRGTIQPAAEMLSGRLPQFWFSAQPEFKPEHVPVLKNFERQRVHLEDRRPGFGIERVLYDFNPRLHCFSPALEAQFVTEASGVLPVLERISDARPKEDFAIDRHLAAFLAARFPDGGHDWFEPLGSADPAQRILGTLYLLARLQAKYGPPSVPALAQRIARQFPASIDRYRNRTRRSQLKAELPKLVARGNLVEILSFLDNAAERQRDSAGFQAALREHAMIEHQLQALRLQAPRREQQAQALGARVAATSSGILAWLVGLAAVVLLG